MCCTYIVHDSRQIAYLVCTQGDRGQSHLLFIHTLTHTHTHTHTHTQNTVRLHGHLGAFPEACAPAEFDWNSTIFLCHWRHFLYL